MTMHDHHQHPGELEVQKLRGVPYHATVDVPHYISDDMPMQHVIFFSNLLYFAICTVDARGRPWPTLLVGTTEQPSPVRAKDSQTLVSMTRLPLGDPFARSLERNTSSSRLWAGLGVDFTNRRRNKVAGVVSSAVVDKESVYLVLEANESMGNCPKYITERQLIPLERQSELAVDAFDDASPLTSDEVAVVERASTVYLASRHFTDRPQETDMGLNHRGGNPGFVRVERNDKGEAIALILPDYSGNRFYQSLGNVQTDRLAGLVVPCFATGDILHVTGTAENIFGAAAEAIMPRVSLLTRILITGHVLIKQGIHLHMLGPETYSPYNPPLRYLKPELQSRGIDVAGEVDITASLVEVQCLSRHISSFTFELSKPVRHTPGGFAVFDFSGHIQREYRHMNQRTPQQVNDDYVRTWTISSAPPFDPLTQTFGETKRITCTIKHVEEGAVTPFLHSQRPTKSRPLRLPLRGVGGDFTAFETSPLRVESKMIWIGAGVGITPFMSFASGLRNAALDTDVVLMFAARGDESALASTVFAPYSFISHMFLFNSSRAKAASPTRSRSSAVTTHHRRMNLPDFQAIADIAERTAFICGPPAFMAAVTALLKSAGVSDHRIKQESFAF